MSRFKFGLVNQQVDGMQYINTYVKLKKIGSVSKGCCPFHNEKTPSFTVYPKGYTDPQTKKVQDNASFYCFGCGKGGDVITFKQFQINSSLQNEDCTREEACDMLINELGLNINDENSELEFLKEERIRMEHADCKMLSVTEVNLICSCICRNYLLWIKEKYPNKWDEEKKIVEKFFSYFDYTLPERNQIEALQLIDEVNMKINKRRELLVQGMQGNEKEMG